MWYFVQSFRPTLNEVGRANESPMHGWSATLNSKVRHIKYYHILIASKCIALCLRLPVWLSYVKVQSCDSFRRRIGMRNHANDMNIQRKFLFHLFLSKTGYCLKPPVYASKQSRWKFTDHNKKNHYEFYKKKVYIIKTIMIFNEILVTPILVRLPR